MNSPLVVENRMLKSNPKVSFSDANMGALNREVADLAIAVACGASLGVVA